MALTRYYLDTNAWVELLRSQNGLNEVLDAWRSTRFELIFSQENMNELLDNANIGFATRQRDLPRLTALVDVVTADELAIFDHGKLGMMKLASEVKSVVYSRHMSSAKKADRNTIADGVHLVNAIGQDAVLVTSDGEVMASAGREDLICISLSRFLDIEHLGANHKI